MVLSQTVGIPHYPTAYTCNQSIFPNFLLLKPIMLMSFGDVFQKINIKPVTFGALAGTRLGSYRHCWRPGQGFDVGGYWYR